MGNLTKNMLISIKKWILSKNQTVFIISNETRGIYLGIIDKMGE